MLRKNINRYVHSYVEVLLNRLYAIVEEKDKEKILQLIRDNDYKEIQMSKFAEDNYPGMNFSVYKSLELLRILKEKFWDDVNPDSSNMHKDIQTADTILFSNEAKFSSSWLIEMPYEFTAKVNTNVVNDITTLNLTEQELLIYLRNSDAHGGVEILSGGMQNEIGGLIKFKNKKANAKFSEIVMTSDDLNALIGKQYKRIYEKKGLRSLSIFRKEQVSQLENSIKNRDEFRDFIKKFKIAIAEDPLLNGEKNARVRFIKENFYILSDLQFFGDVDFFENDESVETKEFSEEEIIEMEQYIEKHKSFYEKNVFEQHNFINEYCRKKYFDEKEYELLKILQDLDKKIKSGISLENMGENLREPVKIPSYEISEIFCLLTKAVYLTNKESLFDLNPSSYNNIDISNIAISNMRSKANRSYVENVFEHLRNSFTHYRYNSLNIDEKELDAEVELYDFRVKKNGIQEQTFQAKTDLFTCFETVVHSEFLKELNDNYTNPNNQILNFTEEERVYFIAQKMIKDRNFKGLQEKDRNNIILAELAVLLDYKNIRYIGTELKNREFILKLIKDTPKIYSELGMFNDDLEIFQEAISRNGGMFVYGNEELKNKENALIALSNSQNEYFPIDIYSNIPDEWTKDEEFLKEMVMACPKTLASVVFREDNTIKQAIITDVEIAKCVAQKDGTYLDFFEPDIINNVEIALMALESSGLSVSEMFSPDIINTPEIQNKIQYLESLEYKNLYLEEKKAKIDEKNKKINALLKMLRDDADKSSGRPFIQSDIQSDIEAIWGVNRYTEISKKFSEFLLDDLRKQADEVGITDIEKIKYKIIVGERIQSNGETARAISIELVEEEPNGR